MSLLRCLRLRHDPLSRQVTVVPSVSTSAAALAQEGGEGGGFDMETLERMRIVGTSDSLEKSYFRLTSAPDPSTVRPEPVLMLALSALKQKWKRSEVEYPWLCDQVRPHEHEPHTLRPMRIRNNPQNFL